MPLSQFADPTVAIEPPPQESDFDLYLQAQAAIEDPFGMSWMDSPSSSSSSSSSSSEKSWTDVFTGVGRNFVTDLANAIGGKVTGYNPNDPKQVAAISAARQREAQAEQTKTFLLVGGVVAAVVVGAMVLRKGKR